MRLALTLAFALACLAGPASALVKDPPDDPNWSYSDSFFSPPLTTLESNSDPRCEAEGQAIMAMMNKIRADPGLLTRPSKTGDMGEANSYKFNWDKYHDWQGYRCIQVFISYNGTAPIVRSDRRTWDTRYIYLQGHTPVRRAHEPIPMQNPAGVWDVRTGTGEHFVIDLAANGRDVSGALKTDGGTGTLEGKLYGSQMLDLQYSMPSRSGEAIVIIKGDTFTGPDKAGGTPWLGMRLPGSAEVLGTWNVSTNRGANYVLMLDRAGSAVYGRIYVNGGMEGSVGGQISGQTVYLTYSMPDGRSGHPILTITDNVISGVDQAAVVAGQMPPIVPEAWQGTRK